MKLLVKIDLRKIEGPTADEQEVLDAISDLLDGEELEAGDGAVYEVTAVMSGDRK